MTNGAPMHDGMERRGLTRDRAAAHMLNAGLLAALGTIVLAWAQRETHQVWAFPAGLSAWLSGILLFGVGLRAYLRGH